MQHWNQIRQVFEEALELEEPKRGLFVESRFGQSPGARREVLRLLRHHEPQPPRACATEPRGAGLERPRPPQDETDGLAAHDLVPGLVPGTELDGFTLLGQLGAGGMGVVYEAQQAQPRRRVALKVLGPSALGEDAMRRFHQEADLLGQLTHAGIAQVYGSGSARLPDGREVAYFAMELVPGGSDLVSHAQHAGLDLAAKLRLMAEVASAVGHGHGRGIVHRDLKPANLLVDREGRPKVIDYGIARQETAGAWSQTLTTASGQLMGTLAYMAPEQLDGGSGSDARADVYALGVVAHELFGGRRPFQSSSAGVTELKSILERQPAPRLSLHAPGLPRDLDWVLACALDPEPKRRYTDGSALAKDLEAVLYGHPVSARPPTQAYRLTRWIGRHRRLTLSLGALFLSLVVGLAGTLAGWRAAGLREAALTREVTRTSALQELWALYVQALWRDQVREEPLNPAEVFEGAFRQFRRKERPPEVQVLGLTLLGHVNLTLNRHHNADRNLQRALKKGSDLDPASTEVQNARALLAIVRSRSGNQAGAREQVDTLLALKRPELLASDPFSLDIGADFAALLYSLGEVSAGDAWMSWIDGEAVRLFGGRDPRLNAHRQHWAKQILAWGDPEQALELLEEQLTRMRSQGALDLGAAPVLRIRAWTLSTLGQHSEALQSQRHAVQLVQALQPRLSPGRLGTLEIELAWLLLHAGHVEEARPLFEAIQERPLWQSDKERQNQYRRLAGTPRIWAEPPPRGVIDLLPLPVMTSIGLAYCQAREGQLAEAEAQLDAIDCELQDLLATEHPNRAVALAIRARILAARGAQEASRNLFQESARVLSGRSDLHFEHYQTLRTWSQLP